MIRQSRKQPNTPNLSDLTAKCSQVADINKSIAELTESKKALMEEIAETALANGINKLPGDTWNLSYCEGRMYLDEGLLLEQGVTIDVIERAKRRGKAYYEVRRKTSKQG